MIQIPYDGKVAMIYHQIGHNPALGAYRPNPEWDANTQNIQGLLLTNLPRKSVNKTLTDVGSGHGKWPALLSPYFNQIVSIEPNEEFVAKQEILLEKLKIQNVDLYQDGMPDCISKINSECLLLSGSLYLTEDWKSCYRSLLDNVILQWIAIFDGPDLDDFDPSLFSEDHGSLSNRLPIVRGDEWYMHDLAEEEGWSARLFDIEKDEQITKPDSPDRWLLILER